MLITILLSVSNQENFRGNLMNDNAANSKESHHQNEIDINELINVIRSRILLIASISSVAIISSIIYSLLLPNVYSSRALLSPVEKQSQMSGMMGAYSSVAGLAGISLPSGGSSQSSEAVIRITSFEFFSKFFYPNISLENLVAVKSWDAKSNTITYDDVYFENQKWIQKPSKQSAFKSYLNSILVFQDLETGFVTISGSHHSPIIAQKWVDIIVKEINESMRDAKKVKVIKSLDFLNNQTRKTNYEEVRLALAALQEEQMKSLMLIESSEDYVFEVIDAAIVPEQKSGPKRSMIVILSTIIASLLAVIFVISSHFLRKSV